MASSPKCCSGTCVQMSLDVAHGLCKAAKPDPWCAGNKCMSASDCSCDGASCTMDYSTMQSTCVTNAGW